MWWRAVGAEMFDAADCGQHWAEGRTTGTAEPKDFATDPVLLSCKSKGEERGGVEGGIRRSGEVEVKRTDGES